MDAQMSAWKIGGWGSMEELLGDQFYPKGVEFGSTGKELLGDENQLTLEGLNRLDGLLDEFLAASTSENGGKTAMKNSIDNEDVFPDWVENKIDFSLLENFDNLDKLLDDPDLVMEEEKSNKLSVNNFEEDNVQFLLFEESVKGITIPVKEDPESPPYSYPSSPEGLVPNISAPCSPISEPPSSFDNILLSNQIYPSETPLETSTIPTTFTIIIPNGDVAGLLANLEEISNIEMFTTSTAIDLENPGYVVPIHSVEEPLPEAEESASNNFQGILKDKVVLKTTNEGEKTSKGSRGRKRKSIEEFEASNSNSSSNYHPPKPKQRKERKRMQNKEAATRYRQKKRVEAETVGGVEEKLLEENTVLKDKAQQLSNEISYLKGLMRDMFKARGLLK